MFGSKSVESSNELENVRVETPSVFKKNEKSIKGLIAPGGIDASYTNHIEISSTRTAIFTLKQRRYILISSTISQK